MKLHCSLVSHLKLLAAAGVMAALSACGGGGADSGADTVPQRTALSARTVQGGAQAMAAASLAAVPAPAAGTIRMHFHRAGGDYGQWGVYSWDGPVNPSSTWITDRFMMNQSDSFGGYVDIPVNTSKTAIWFLVTDGSGNKNCGNDQSAQFNSNIASAGQEIWMLEADCTIYSSQPAISYGNLNNASAYWLSASTLAWPGAPASGASYKLYYAANGGLASSVDGVSGADGSIALTVAGALPAALQQKFSYLGLSLIHI